MNFFNLSFFKKQQQPHRKFYRKIFVLLSRLIEHKMTVPDQTAVLSLFMIGIRDDEFMLCSGGIYCKLAQKVFFLSDFWKTNRSQKEEKRMMFCRVSADANLIEVF